MKVIQAEMVREDNPNISTVAWIEYRPDLKVGRRLSFKGDRETWWKIKTLYPSIKNSDHINQDWHVGGL